MDWYGTEPYKQLAEATRTLDYARAAAIIEKQIAVTEGPEQIFWRRIRLGMALQLAKDSRSAAVVLADMIRLIDLCGPTDDENRQKLVIGALSVAVYLERFNLLPAMMPRLRPELRQVIPTYDYWVTRAVMHKACNRWRKAYRAFGRGLEQTRAWSEHQFKAIGGVRVFLYAELAIAALHCGLADQAAAHAATAETIYRERPRPYMNPLLLFLAIGEVAFSQGRVQHARSALQEGLALYAQSQYRGRWSPYSVDYELLAARIALAEGNLAGFRYFCDRAQALCAEYDLPLSAARVGTLLESTER